MTMANQDFSEQAGIREATVLAKTGKTWADWCALLDEAGAMAWSHQETAAYVHETCGIGAWWSQSVTVGYERIRGKRRMHEKTDGYATSVSKTVNASAERVFVLWADESLREGFLPAKTGVEITKITPAKNLRMRWADGSRVSVELYPKSESKMQLVVQHEKLADEAAMHAAKRFWQSVLARFLDQL